MLGEKLKAALELAGVHTTQAATYIGISEGNLYKMFKKDSFEIEYLRKASQLTGQPLSFFLNEDSQILQNSQKLEPQGVAIFENAINQIESNLEKRYEKIISHYEALLRRYEGGNVNFLNPVAGARVVPMYFLKESA